MAIVRRRGAILAVALLGALLGAPWADSAAHAQEDPAAPGATLVELCTENELEPRTCKSFDSGSLLFAQACGQLPLPPEACANVTDGRTIDRGLIDAYEQSWAWRALRLQTGLDDHEPLRNVLMPHTHNSSNSTANAPSLSNIDPNQRYSIEDQLRMGIRGIELDLHWAPHPSGTAATGGKAVVLCHGRTEGVGPLTIHLGCSVDRLFAEGLVEIRRFLDAPGNEDEVVLLYLENQMDGDPIAHEQAGAILEEELGDLVARPPAAETCVPMPLDSSRADLRSAGHRVLIVGNCGPGSWDDLVHERGPDWDEGGDGSGYPEFPACIAERDEREYDAKWIRVYEDSTWLSAMVGGATPPVTPAETRSMVRCGVDMVGFDRLEPNDGRLEALVWSWAPDEPVLDAGKRCVAWGDDARFRAADCGETRGYACRTSAGDWVVPPERGPWRNGFAACEGVDAHYAVPPTGWQNEQLRIAAGAPTELWLDYQSIEVQGAWVVAAQSAPVAARSAGPGTLPATGGSGAVGPAAVLALAGVAALALRVRR
jgi:hypothetical protein